MCLGRDSWSMRVSGEAFTTYVGGNVLELGGIANLPRSAVPIHTTRWFRSAFTTASDLSWTGSLSHVERNRRCLVIVTVHKQLQRADFVGRQVVVLRGAERVWRKRAITRGATSGELFQVLVGDDSGVFVCVAVLKRASDRRMTRGTSCNLRPVCRASSVAGPSDPAPFCGLIRSCYSTAFQNSKYNDCKKSVSAEPKGHSIPRRSRAVSPARDP